MVYFLRSDYIYAAVAAEHRGYGDSKAQQRVVYEPALKEIPLRKRNGPWRAISSAVWSDRI